MALLLYLRSLCYSILTAQHAILMLLSYYAQHMHTLQALIGMCVCVCLCVRVGVCVLECNVVILNCVTPKMTPLKACMSKTLTLSPL